jgi:hypothetical protein
MDFDCHEHQIFFSILFYRAFTFHYYSIDIYEFEFVSSKNNEKQTIILEYHQHNILSKNNIRNNSKHVSVRAFFARGLNFF